MVEPLSASVITSRLLAVVYAKGVVRVMPLANPLALKVALPLYTSVAPLMAVAYVSVAHVVVAVGISLRYILTGIVILGGQLKLFHSSAVIVPLVAISVDR